MRYDETLARGNGYGPGRWRFEPGMLFGARSAWWASADGVLATRASAHNGLDMRLYEEEGGRERVFGAGGSVLVAGPGVIVGIVRDFMGHSVFVEHGDDGGEGRLYTAYGHLTPDEGIIRGVRVVRGGRIGEVSAGRGGNVPPHMHFSAFRASGRKGPPEFDWTVLEGAGEVVFLDPLDSRA